MKFKCYINNAFNTDVLFMKLIESNKTTAGQNLGLINYCVKMCTHCSINTNAILN